jgi:hypothetical protein
MELISIISLLVIVVVFLIKIRRSYSYFFLLLFLFPTIVVVNQDCSSYNHVDKISLVFFLFSFLDVIIELFLGHLGKSFDGTSWYYDSYFIVEIYSVFFLFFFYFKLRKFNFLVMKNNFRLLFRDLYFNLLFGLLILFSFFYFHFFTDPIYNSTTNIEFSKENNIFLLSYLSVYFLISIAIVLKKKYLHYEIRQLFFLVLLLFFPIISVSNEYRYVGKCASEGFNYERIVSISPLINAIPKTIFSFFQDSKREHFDSFLQIKIYSLFQIAIVLLLFPSILIAKEEKNAE